ncbi:MAG TPA: hypothetical protein PK239_01860 [Chitinophagales bacterium]|nr:hypothetical protein [Chitinophagales bacterium]
MKQSFVKQFVLIAFTLVFVGGMFTSCHRGAGCPGKITVVEQPYSAEQDC